MSHKGMIHSGYRVVIKNNLVTLRTTSVSKEVQPEVKSNGNKVTCKDIHIDITDESSFKVPMEIHKKKNTCSKFLL